MCLKSNVNFNIKSYPIYPTYPILADDVPILQLLTNTTNYNYANMHTTVAQDKD